MIKNFLISVIFEKLFLHDELGISKQELFDKNDETCDHFLIFDGQKLSDLLECFLWKNGKIRAYGNSQRF